MKTVSTIALAVFVLGFAHAGTTEETPAPKGGVQSPLVGLRLLDLDGEMVDLGSSLGQGPLLLDFWATWCKPCLAALPELNELYLDLEPRGLRMLGINEDEQSNVSKVKPFVRTHGFEFPVVLDLNREAQTRLNALVLPTTLLLDSEGQVVYTQFGYRPGETKKLRKKIEALLQSTPHE